MKGWLLDTNILSELRRQRPEPRVLGFIANQPLESLFVSTVTFAEIRFGIEMVPDPLKRADLSDWLTQTLHGARVLGGNGRGAADRQRHVARHHE